jgi:hypothetical protein
MAMKKKADVGGIIEIKPPNFLIAEFEIIGTAPFVANKFAEEAKQQMRDAMALGGKAKARKKAEERPPKDFQKDYEGSMHKAKDADWYGIPATAFKAAIVRACSHVGIEMTRAKQCLFLVQDGFGEDGTTPLMRITHGKPEYFEAYVNNANGSPDIRARGSWPPGWRCTLRIKYDADSFTPSTIANLIVRAGISIGVGAGRPFSSHSCGMGWGTFELYDKEEAEAAE